MILKEKNSTFQSCHYCHEGPGAYRIDLDNSNLIYVCEKHRIEKHPDLVKGLEKEAEFLRG